MSIGSQIANVEAELLHVCFHIKGENDFVIDD
jgi:hypothetical protein